MKAMSQDFIPRNFADRLTKIWNSICRRLIRFERRRERQLRLCENLALGERRSLSVVEFGSRKLLLGSTGTSLTMLATFEETGADTDFPTWQFVNGDLVRSA